MDPSFIAINTAYLLYVGATIPKRIVPLRTILVLASVAFIVYGLIADNRSVIAWNLLFGLAQLTQLLRKLRAERSIALTPEEESVRSAHFGSMVPRDFLMFWSLGHERAVGNQQLITQNERNDNLIMVLTGAAVVTVDGRHIADRGPGNILGEASFVTGDPASATVVMSSDATIRMWPHETLDALTRAQPDVASSLLSAFARELSLKIKTTTS